MPHRKPHIVIRTFGGSLAASLLVHVGLVAVLVAWWSQARSLPRMSAPASTSAREIGLPWEVSPEPLARVPSRETRPSQAPTEPVEFSDPLLNEAFTPPPARRTPPPLPREPEIHRIARASWKATPHPSIVETVATVVPEVEPPPTAAPQAQPLIEPEERPGTNSKPPYPTLALRRGWEGLVLLRILVRADGGVGRVEVIESSGHALLDRAAMECVLTWEYEPARRGALAVEHELDVPVRFELTEH